jgi:hypothetical protein
MRWSQEQGPGIPVQTIQWLLLMHAWHITIGAASSGIFWQFSHFKQAIIWCRLYVLCVC